MEPKPTLRELIDACRPDHDDPQRPELAAELAPLAREMSGNASTAAAYERSQHFDRQVRSALDDVPLPAGLAEKMLAGCEAALVEPAEHEARRASNRVSRRTAILGGLATAASVLAALVFFTSFKPAAPVSEEQLAQLALQWRDQVTPAKLTAIKTDTLKAFPLDPAVIVNPSRVATLSSSVVAYELIRGKDGRRALLIVQRTNGVHSISNFPSPKSRLPSSGGTYMAAWQRQQQGFVYIIIFSDEYRLDDFVKAVKVT